MLQKRRRERYDPERSDPHRSQVQVEVDFLLRILGGYQTPANAQIVHSGQACVVKEDNISERIYTIREGDTLVLQCLVKGHPRPQVHTRT
ncbi:MAM domain-containing glycosylphosphatidylinositol anchor protein 1 [Tachysurus ichikawai]